MLHIILMILKILGIFLLVLLGLVLLLVLSVLFVPVCYSGWGKKEGAAYEGKASVSWLFYLIHGTVQYEKEQSRFEIYLFGVPLLKLKKVMENRKKKKEEVPKKVSEEVPGKKPVPPEKRNIPPEKQSREEKSAEKIPVKIQPEKKPTEKNPVKIPKEKKKSFGERVKKIRLTFREFCDKIKEWRTFLTSDTVKAAFHFLKEKGKKLLRHILPRKIKGRLVFGFEDPSWTGQVLGAAAVLYPWYQDRFQLIPVFDQAVLEGEVRFSGRIYGGYLLWTAWQIYKNKDVREIYHRFQNKEA